MTNTPTTREIPRIRSFVRRAGRMTIAQRQHLSEESPFSFRLPLNPTAENQRSLTTWLTTTFTEPPLPWALDIGFGMGDSTPQLALAYPQYRWLAIDVHPPGIGRLLHLIEKMAVRNVRIIEGDTMDVLALLQNESIGLCKCFFPDPWPKKRHHKRRLVQSALINLLAQKMQSQGLWHIATDIDDYGEHIRTSMMGATLWQKISDQINRHKDELCKDSLDDSRLLRPMTKFARRALEEGRKIHSLAYLRALPEIHFS